MIRILNLSLYRDKLVDRWISCDSIYRILLVHPPSQFGSTIEGNSICRHGLTGWRGLDAWPTVPVWLCAYCRWLAGSGSARTGDYGYMHDIQNINHNICSCDNLLCLWFAVFEKAGERADRGPGHTYTVVLAKALQKLTLRSNLVEVLPMQLL